MLYDHQIAAAYLEGRNPAQEEAFSLLQGYEKADPKRRDIVRELDVQLESIVEEFPTFNKDLFQAVFPKYEEQLRNVTIMAVVGTRENRIVKTEDSFCILIDLIHIADYTRIVSQMTYILQNYLTFELSKFLIHERFPVRSRKYLSLLNHLAFTNGLANYLAWNESCNNYKFYTQKYEAHKERSFGLLAQALQVETKALQHKILVSAVSQEFWNQFPSVAGMFYFDDIYRDLGKEGVVLLYEHGPKNFIQTIFHS